jgi:hypothetical protein
MVGRKAILGRNVGESRDLKFLDLNRASPLVAFFVAAQFYLMGFVNQ